MKPSTRTRRRVYLIRFRGMVKIGSSARPAERLKAICPGGEVIHEIRSANAFQIEYALHHRFADRLVDGMGREWFRLSSDEVASLKGVECADAVSDLPANLQPSGKRRRRPASRPTQPMLYLYGPMRNVVSRLENSEGRTVEILDCGHRQEVRADALGRSDSARRRCRQCRPQAA